MSCPFCDGQAVLAKAPTQLTYKGEEFNVVGYFYLCEKCKEEFTTTKSDTATIAQVHEAYALKQQP